MGSMIQAGGRTGHYAAGVAMLAFGWCSLGEAASSSLAPAGNPPAAVQSVHAGAADAARGKAIHVENVHLLVVGIASVLMLSCFRSPRSGYCRRSCQSDVDAMVRTALRTVERSRRVPVPSQRVAPTLALGQQGLRARVGAALGALRSARAIIAILALPATAWSASGDGRNLLANGGFEQGALSAEVPAWSAYASDGESTAAVADDVVRNGQGALVLSANRAAGMFNGVVQTIDVVAGRRYEMDAFVHVVPTNLLNGTAYGQLVVEWKAEDGTEINRVWSDTWDQSMSLTEWRHVQLGNLVAPDGAAKAVCGIHLFDGAEASRGAVVVDDVALTALDAGRVAFAPERRGSIE